MRKAAAPSSRIPPEKSNSNLFCRDKCSLRTVGKIDGYTFNFKFEILKRKTESFASKLKDFEISRSYLYNLRKVWLATELSVENMGKIYGFSIVTNWDEAEVIHRATTDICGIFQCVERH